MQNGHSLYQPEISIASVSKGIVEYITEDPTVYYNRGKVGSLSVLLEYDDQATLVDVLLYLKQRGFIPHSLSSNQKEIPILTNLSKLLNDFRDHPTLEFI